jgi:hypothetical protein
MNEKSLIHCLAEAFDHYRAGRRVNSRAQKSHPSHLRRSLGNLALWFRPNGGTLVIIAALLLTQRVWARSATASSGTVGTSFTTVNYQGRLADGSGTPVSDTVTLVFALYDAVAEGSLIWGPESHDNVPVSDGLFNVQLGSQMPGGIPINVLDDGDVWLEVIVEGETLSPREKLAAVPYAIISGTVLDGSITKAKIMDGAVTQAKAPLLVEAVNKPNTQLQYGAVWAMATQQTDELVVDIDFNPDFEDMPFLVLQPSWSTTPYVIANPSDSCNGDVCRVSVRRTDQETWSPGQGSSVQWIAVRDH